uniref:Uncharacterized protein n=1 Tax=Arion vulgaris TaxID=1028688 RepID=A0A0B6Z586_9EUPU
MGNKNANRIWSAQSVELVTYMIQNRNKHDKYYYIISIKFLNVSQFKMLKKLASR